MGEKLSGGFWFYVHGHMVPSVLQSSRAIKSWQIDVFLNSGHSYTELIQFSTHKPKFLAVLASEPEDHFPEISVQITCKQVYCVVNHNMAKHHATLRIVDISIVAWISGCV